MTNSPSFHIKKVDQDIINFLIFSNDFVTSYDIASHCGITQRQVRNEMPHIIDIIRQLGCQIVSKQSRGYIIPDSTDKKYLEELFNSSDSTLVVERNWNGARQQQLIELLFNHDDEYLKINDIADALYLSRSSTINELKKAQIEVFEKNNIKIENKTHVGVRIIGDELSKRRFMLDCVFNVFGQTDTINKFLDLFYNHPNSTETKIFQILKKYHVFMSDIALTDFILYVVYANQRIIKNKIITEINDVSEIKKSEEYKAAKEIGELLSKSFDYSIPREEIDAIAIMLVSKRSTKKMTISYNQTAIKIATKTIKKIQEKMRISLNDDSFYTSFLKYINNTILTLRFNEKVRNPLYEEAASNYPLANEMSKITADILKEETGLSMSRSHKTYYTILFHTAIIDNINIIKNALLVDGFGTAATSSVTKLIHNAIGNKIQIIDSCMYFELDQKALSSYDLIISTIPIFKTMPIPVANISQFVSTDDIRKIINIIHSADANDFKPEFYLNPNLFILEDKKISFSSVTKIIEDNISKCAPQLSNSHIHSMCINNENKIEVYLNGVMTILSSHSSLPSLMCITLGK